MALVKQVYVLTANFPEHELYGLRSQMRRAAVSIPSNIAEGNGRRSTGEYLQFLGNARGSLAELHTQALLSRELGFVQTDDYQPIEGAIDEVRRMLGGLVTSLSRA